MFHRNRIPRTGETARMLAVLDSQTRPYTDPRAGYPIAEQARTARAEGVARRIDQLQSRQEA